MNCVDGPGGRWCCPPPYLASCAPIPTEPTVCAGPFGTLSNIYCGPSVWFAGAPQQQHTDGTLVLALGALLAAGAVALVVHQHRHGPDLL